MALIVLFLKDVMLIPAAKAIRRAMSFSEEEYIEISSKARECVERQFDYHNWTKKIKQAIESMYSENE